MRKISHRNAFTLIEILVVLIILSTLGAMVTTAVSGVRTTAREARTKRIISIVDSVIAEQYEQLRYRPLAVEIPALYEETNIGVLGWEVLADEAARVRLMMLRDLQRLEIPDRYTDILNIVRSSGIEPGTPLISEVPIEIKAAVSQVITDQGLIRQRREELDKRQPAPVVWFGLSNAKSHPKQDGYRRRIEAAIEIDSNSNERRYSWTPEHQGAECLYLILSTSYIGGQPAIAAIPNSNIGDTDNDGMLEILDGWGQPLQFIRWPVGFTPSSGEFNVDFEQTVNVNSVDDFDLFRVDHSYLKNTDPGSVLVRDTNAPSELYRPWSMRPLIFSVGEDGEGGLAVNPGDQPGLPQYNFSYASTSWDLPVTSDYFGDEWEGRGGGRISYIDPYLRLFTSLNPTQCLPGELLGKTNPAERKKAFNQSIDNITNYQLQVSP